MFLFTGESVRLNKNAHCFAVEPSRLALRSASKLALFAISSLCSFLLPPGYTIKTHAKGAYKTPTRVSFSMQNRGELPFLWQFTLFVVSSRIAVGICSILALGNRNSLTIAQKGFLHDKERMISSVLINEKMTDRTLTNAVGRLTFISLYSLFPIEADRFYFFAF